METLLGKFVGIHFRLPKSIKVTLTEQLHIYLQAIYFWLNTSYLLHVDANSSDIGEVGDTDDGIYET